MGVLRLPGEASVRALAAAVLDSRAVESLQSLRASPALEAQMARLERMRAHLLTLLDDGYPTTLREIADPPPVVYVMGNLAASDARAVAVVGTRRATAYARQVVE